MVYVVIIVCETLIRIELSHARNHGSFVFDAESVSLCLMKSESPSNVAR